MSRECPGRNCYRNLIIQINLLKPEGFYTEGFTMEVFFEIDLLRSDDLYIDEILMEVSFRN